MSDAEKYEYRIECDGMVVETDSMLFAAHMVWPEQEDIGGEDDEETDCRKLPFKREKISTRKDARDVARDLFDETSEHVPYQIRKQGQSDLDVGRLYKLREAFQRKAGNSSYDHAGRAAYQDAFEKLDAVLRGESWTESP